MRNIGEVLSSAILKEIAKIDFLDTAKILKVYYTKETDTYGEIIYPGTAKILIQDGTNENQLNGVPILSINASIDCGVKMFPQEGDIVVIAYLEQDKHAPVILGSIFTEETLFDETESEWMIKHPSGSYIKFDNEGNIILSVPTGKEVKVI
jgi:hypothetical protein